MIIKIEGIKCNNCIKKIKEAFKKNGAKDVKVDFEGVEFENLQEKEAIEVIEDLGFNVLYK